MQTKLSVLFAAMLVAATAHAAPSGVATVKPQSGTSTPAKRHMPTNAAARVLVVMDVAPWGTTAIEDVLGSLGVPYDSVDSSGFASVRLAKYTTIIVASDQPQATYDAMLGYQNVVTRWVNRGARTLVFNGADNGYETGVWSVVLPGGVRRGGLNYAATNTIVNPASPLVVDVPLTFEGSAASHTYLTPTVPDSVVAIDDLGNATLLDYCQGPGRIIASGQTLEFAYQYQWESQNLLLNILREATSAPGCPAR